MAKKRKSEATHFGQEQSTVRRRWNRTMAEDNDNLVESGDTLVVEVPESVNEAIIADHNYDGNYGGEEEYQPEGDEDEDDDDGGEYQFCQSLSDELKCPICLCHLVNPKVLGNCGHVFCGQCIANWRSMGRRNNHNNSNNQRRCRHCPVCSKFIGKITKCNVLQNICDLFGEYWPSEHLNDDDEEGGGEDNGTNYENEDAEATESAEPEDNVQVTEDTTIVTIHVDVRSL